MTSSNSIVTRDELTALTDASIKVASILEAIKNQLEQLDKLDEIDEQLRHVIIKRIIEEVIIGKGLDISDKESKISKEIALIQELVKVAQDLVLANKEHQRKVVLVIVLATAFLGGVKGLGDFLYRREMQNTIEIQPIRYKFDRTVGKYYFVDPATNDTLYVMSKEELP